jgi:hypothetical protein
VKQQKKHRLLFPFIVLTISATTAVIYARQYPGITLTADSPTYLTVLAKMTAHHLSLASLVDAVRLPGYPLFIYVIAFSNLSIATLLQMVLFIGICIISYWIALLTFDTPWIALVIGLLVATDPVLIGYFKPIMTEALACFLLSSLTLAGILYLRTARPLPLVICGLLLYWLIFTRPEWLVLPILLFPLLLLAARGRKKNTLLHVGIALALALCMYSSVGLYIHANQQQNGYNGFSAISNMNLLGKVLQYRMEDEAPASQSSHTPRLDACIAKLNGNRDPWPLMACTRDLASPWATPAGAYATATIVSHPLEFLVKSAPVFFVSLVAYFDPSPPSTQIPLFLRTESVLHQGLYACNILLPLFIGWPLWLLWLLRRKRPITHTVWIMTMLWGIVFYGSVLVALAGYMEQDYARFHAVFLPLTIIVIWGSLLLGADLLLKRVRRT